jgi:CheY-like chemotaxis protein
MKKADILLIEDDTWLAELYQDILQTEGYAVHRAASADEGLTALDGVTPDCIVLDMYLPGHNGVEFLHECASYQDTKNVPIIVLSSIAESDMGLTKQRWRQYGVEAYLYKPTTKPATLLEAIAFVVESYASKKSEQFA